MASWPLRVPKAVTVESFRPGFGKTPLIGVHAPQCGADPGEDPEGATRDGRLPAHAHEPVRVPLPDARPCQAPSRRSRPTRAPTAISGADITAGDVAPQGHDADIDGGILIGDRDGAEVAAGQAGRAALRAARQGGRTRQPAKIRRSRSWLIARQIRPSGLTVATSSPATMALTTASSTDWTAAR